jgi:PKHD-type hydroxylase
VYDATEGGHYDWHIDYGPDNMKPRKISMSIQLTDPSKYQGCDLQFMLSNEIRVAPRTRGASNARFPT